MGSAAAPLHYKQKSMNAGQTITVILLFALMITALRLAYLYGYERGVNDLTRRIDEGIKKLKEEGHEED